MHKRRFSSQYNPVAWPAELQDLRKQLALPFVKFDVFGLHTFTGVALAGTPWLYAISDSFPTVAAKPHSRGGGLGLTIVQQIARAHGGRVAVVSAPGRGSCFLRCICQLCNLCGDEFC
jgi:hypothetical protein